MKSLEKNLASAKKLDRQTRTNFNGVSIAGAVANQELLEGCGYGVLVMDFITNAVVRMGKGMYSRS